MRHLPHEEQAMLGNALVMGGCPPMLAKLGCAFFEAIHAKTQEHITEHYPEIEGEDRALSVTHTAFEGITGIAVEMMQSIESATMSLHNSALALLVAEWLYFGRDQPRADVQTRDMPAFSEMSLGDFLRALADAFDAAGGYEADGEVRQNHDAQAVRVSIVPIDQMPPPTREDEDLNNLIEAFQQFMSELPTTDDSEEN